MSGAEATAVPKAGSPARAELSPSGRVVKSGVPCHSCSLQPSQHSNAGPVDKEGRVAVVRGQVACPSGQPHQTTTGSAAGRRLWLEDTIGAPQGRPAQAHRQLPGRTPRASSAAPGCGTRQAAASLASVSLFETEQHCTCCRGVRCWAQGCTVSASVTCYSRPIPRATRGAAKPPGCAPAWHHEYLLLHEAPAQEGP